MSLPPVRTSFFALDGGLNQVTPSLSLPPGNVREALNFEVGIDGGYRRRDGYERYDGQAQPYLQNYYRIDCTFTGAVSVGNTIVGDTSSATGVVIAVDSESIYFTKLTGNFVLGEDIEVATVKVAEALGPQQIGGAADPRTNAQYKKLACDVYRADISEVPGAGSVLGVWRYKQKSYAFRNFTGNTEARMYESSASGWVQVDLGYEVAFSNADDDILDAEILTQGGVTATVKRLVIETGTIQSGVNTGRLIITEPVGGSFAAGAATASGGAALTLGGAHTAITIPSGGRYEFVNENFKGQADSFCMYGCNGVGRCFEFDGSVFVPINTGLDDDKPTHIVAHKNHLHVSYRGSSFNSAIGDPYRWAALAGAGEVTAGDDITGYLQMVGSDASDSLAIFTRSRAFILYGASSSDWNLVMFSRESGAMPNTMQNIGEAYMVDEIGIRRLAASDRFGNFQSGQVSNIIRPFFNERVNRANGSMIVRRKNQYRVFFSDGFALFITIDNGKIKGMMPQNHAHTFSCFSSTEDPDGEEWLLAGSTNGFVYRIDKGVNFDGEAMESYIYLPFHHIGSPRTRKRYRRAVYEITGDGFLEFDAMYELGYGSSEIEQGIITQLRTALDPVNWDEFVWDTFYWDGRSLSPSEQDLTGTAENISIMIRANSAVIDSFTINSLILHYSERRNLR